jgi:putative peptidoglycan lipid II flippase
MVRRVFNLMYKEIRGLHQAAYVLAAFTFGSQVLAILRDRLLAHTFGAGYELDLYYTAFRIPDLLFVLFTSVLSVYVLLPFLNQIGERAKQSQLLSQVFTIFLCLYVAFAAILWLGASWYLPLLFTGFEERMDELVLLTRVLLLQPLILGISSIYGVVTQLQHRFVLYAVSPILYNVGIIIGVVALYPLFGLVGLVYGVLLGAFLHLGVQIPYVLNSKLHIRLTWQADWRQLYNIVRTAIPRALTLSLNQVVLLLFVGVATTLTAGSVSVFQFAYNIQSVPLAIIGMSYSVAAFPTLSKLFADKDRVQFNAQIITAMRHIIFWALPIIGLVIVLRAHIVRVLLGSGAFDWADTRLTAAVLATFVISLVAQALLLLLIRALYSAGHTRLPLYVCAVSSALSVGLMYVLFMIWNASPAFAELMQTVFRLDALEGTAVIILGITFAAGQLLQVIGLLMVSSKVFGVPFGAVVPLLWRACVAALVGAGVSYLMLRFIVEGINQDTFIGILLQGGVAGIAGTMAIIGTYYALGASELQEIMAALHRRRRARRTTATNEKTP